MPLPLASSLATAGLDGDRISMNMEDVLQDFRPPVSDIISRSLITSSFNGEDRFGWTPSVGFRVSIPDRFSFVPFERAPVAELRNRLFPSPVIRDKKHQKVPQHTLEPERSVAWWFAQLVHYGLPIVSDREQAQNSIRIAILQDRLFVPLRLKELETKLKRQYVITPSTRSETMLSCHESQDADRITVEAGGSKAEPDVVIAQTVAKRSSHQEPGCRQINSRVNIPPLRLASNCPVGNSAQQVKRYSLKEKSESIDSISSSDSDQDPTPKPSHLFTPHASRITRPAQYPRLREREEKKKKQEKGVLEEVKHLAYSNHICMSKPQSKLVSGSNGEHEASDEDENEPVIDLTKCKTNLKWAAKKAEYAPTKAEVLKNQDSIWEIDDDDVETGSLAFYTPLRFPTRPLEGASDCDEGSVVFVGSKSKSEHKDKVTQGGKRIDVNQTVVNNGKPSQTKSRNHTTIKVKSLKEPLEQKPPTIASASNLKKESQNKAAERKVMKKMHITPSKISKKPGQVIEISSDPGDSSDEEQHTRSESEEEHQLVKYRRSKSVPALQAKASLRRSSSAKLVSSAPKPATKYISASQTPSKSTGRGLCYDRTTQSDRLSTNKPCRDRNKHKAQASGEAYSGSRPKFANNTDEPREPSDKGIKKQRRRGARKSHRTGAKVQCSEKANNYAEIIRNPTACNITEMTGALHTDDEGTIGVTRSPERHDHISSAFQVPAPALSLHKPPPSLLATSDSDGSQSARNKQRETEIPYNPNSVPALHDASATLPTYLKTTVRHESPELSQRALDVPTFEQSKSASNKIAHQQSRSMNITPPSRKRTRPSLTEIEGKTERPSGSKRARVLSSQGTPTSTTRRNI